MKKVLSVLGILFLSVFMVLPSVAAKTETQKNTIYGDITFTETPAETSDGLHNIEISSNKAPEHVYIILTPTNLKDVVVHYDGAYDSLKEYTDKDGNVHVLLKRKSNVSSGNVTYFSATAKMIDTSEGAKCHIAYSPQELACAAIDGMYFDNTGKRVDEEKYTAACNNTTTPVEPDEPNSETGSVVPYVAVAGGLLAIAAIYFYSKKQSKIYKI